jgi:hypothetical protein
MTTTTKPESLVFTEPVTFILTPCPDWCTNGSVMHACEYDDPDKGDCRPHTGPTFGDFLHADGEEWTSAPGEVEVKMSFDSSGFPDLGVAALRQLSADALAAAEWLEAHQ